MPLPDWLKQQEQAPPPTPAPPPAQEAAEPQPEPAPEAAPEAEAAPEPPPAAEPAAEPAAAEPAPEPEPEPAPEPEPIAAAPEPIAAEPEPIAAAPEPEPAAEPAPAPAPVAEAPAAEPEPVAAAPEPEAAPTAVEIPDAPEEAPESSNTGSEVLDVLAQIEKQLSRIGDYHIVEGDVAAATEDGGDDRPTMADLEEREAELHAMRKRVTELETQLADASNEQNEQLATMKKQLEETKAAASSQADARIDAMSEQITGLQSELETAAKALSEAHEALEQASQAPPPAPQAAAAEEAPAGASQELIDQQRLQIERLTEQLATLQSGAEPEEIRERDDRIAELEEQLARMGEQGGKVGKLVAGFGDALSKVRAKGAKKGDDGGASSALEFRLQEVTHERDTLQQRITRLEQELAAARVGGDKQGELHAQQAKELREQWKQLREERAALDEIDPAVPEGSRRRRALIAVTCIVVLATIGAVASMLAANRLLPATVTATVDLQAVRQGGGGVEGEAAAAWERWHRETLADAAFHGKVATRLADQRLDRFADAKDLGRRLDDDLAMYAPKPGALRLTLAGTDRDTLPLLLDTVAAALAQESARTVTSRSDAAVAVIHGERQDGPRIRYAALNAKPVKDHRLIAGVFLFVTGAVVVVFLVRRLQSGLARTKAAMNDEFDLAGADV